MTDKVPMTVQLREEVLSEALQAHREGDMLSIPSHDAEKTSPWVSLPQEEGGTSQWKPKRDKDESSSP